MDHAAPQGLLTPQKFLDRSAVVFPDKVAIQSEGQNYTYAELSRRVNRLASGLRKAGLQKGDRVAFICANISPLLEAHYAVPLAGGVLVPINSRLTAGELAYILNHSGAKFLFAEAEFSSAVRPILGKLDGLKKVVDLLTARGAKPLGELPYEEFLASGSPKALPSTLMDEEDLISVNYTSGTTGKPKGVMTVHRGAYLNALGQVIGVGLTSASKYLWTLPMFHCNGWCFVWAVTAVGGTHILLRKFDPAKAWHLIQTEGVTHLSGSPNLFATLLNDPARPKSLPQPLTFSMGGAQPSPGLIAQMQELGIQVMHGYGLTETYGGYTVCEPQPEWQKLPPRERAKLMARQGVPGVLGDPMRVVDENMRDIRHDGQTLGEVVMRGSTVMKGYYREPEATAKEFRGGWFHSGDLAVVHPDGYVELRARMRDVIIVGGENVSANQVEQTLAQHPDVAEVAVVGVPHEKLGETPKAFVVLADKAKVTARELIAFCRGHLARYKCPTSVEFLAALPKTSTGKVQKFVLREQEWAGEEKRIRGA
jgi:fatty-acyl-CoA synthase